jgi:hypothetical protein
MGSLEVFLAIVVTGIAGILLLVALLAWTRNRSKRNAALSLAFSAMALKGGIMVWALVVLMSDVPLWLLVIDLVVVGLFYVALTIRGEPRAEGA